MEQSGDRLPDSTDGGGRGGEALQGSHHKHRHSNVGCIRGHAIKKGGWLYKIRRQILSFFLSFLREYWHASCSPVAHFQLFSQWIGLPTAPNVAAGNVNC